ncbi:BTB/POZ domain-containing protein KCTD4-like [Gigantopelta aegis]|uniref:BTB/POZ domain-containing protein KCTD4-like n=1 Tax=Gigantopelta aegis TaxID=1735272 RepID=UPI001B888F54|nr:BTB/POZ domain-containing protein KCTD4-like [Gigantopelta aegis]
MSRAERVMRLNVGGMYYTTMKSTLAQIPGTFLWRIATGNQSCLRDDRGNYVIDRDGHVFRHVLNFLRTNKLLLPQGFRELDLLREEALYYGIDTLVYDIDRLVETRRKRRRQPNRMKRLSASVGDSLNHVMHDDDDDDFFEDSYLGNGVF